MDLNLKKSIAERPNLRVRRKIRAPRPIQQGNSSSVLCEGSFRAFPGPSLARLRACAHATRDEALPVAEGVLQNIRTGRRNQLDAVLRKGARRARDDDGTAQKENCQHINRLAAPPCCWLTNLDNSGSPLNVLLSSIRNNDV